MLFNRVLRRLFPQKSKRYGHIISLGYNCEVSYQFFLKYHFVESSLFSWVNTLNIDNLLKGLSDIDSVCSGKIENVNPMWKCFNTNIHFHGRAPMDIWNHNPSIEIIEKDKKELLSRVAHLKLKFINTANDGKKNLYIFKYPVKDESVQIIKNKIDKLFLALKNICKNEFDLLVIFENNTAINIENLIDNPRIYIRRVQFFMPEDNVTGENSDSKNFGKIFNEFRPNFKLKTEKKFKFEKLHLIIF